MVDVSDLNVDMGDITVAGPDDYADSTPPPVPMGNYTLRLDEWDLDKDKEGKVKLGKKGHPVILVKRATIVDGPLMGRTVTYQRIFATPFVRKDAAGNDVTVSGLGDFVRALDRNASFTTIQDVANILNRAVDEGGTFRARVDWEAYDEAHFEAIRGTMDEREARKASTIKGKKGFPDGKPIAVGPSGEQIEAQIRFGTFYPKKD